MRRARRSREAIDPGFGRRRLWRGASESGRGSREQLLEFVEGHAPPVAMVVARLLVEELFVGQRQEGALLLVEPGEKRSARRGGESDEGAVEPAELVEKPLGSARTDGVS